ncbi:MAG: F0F1 ATP synthase subunit epsilon [Alphaproteobacteria bacterium]|nr:F0F1 ATP synthase subunit epsilon [Alphaproteobacteria bacterium]
MADEQQGKVQFELVSPERLVLSSAVDMVVVPGAEGNFGVLPRHSLLISTVRPGVIDVYNGGAITDRIFVAGGFAEVTPERCTVLADEALPVEKIDRAQVEAQLGDLREKLSDASGTARSDAEKAVAVAEAKLVASAASN